MSPKKPLKLFLVDDDPFCLTLYSQHLSNLGYTDVTSFADTAACMSNLALCPDVVFLDFNIGPLNGLELMKNIKRYDYSVYVVIVSGQESVETAFQCLRYGAFDYITKGENDLKKIEDVLHQISRTQLLLLSNTTRL